jgi:hypothetical protein
VVSVLQQHFGLFKEMLLQIRDFPAYSHGAECGFSTNVRVRGRYEVLDFGEQISGHFDGGDVAESAKRQADNILIGVV